MYVCMVGWMYVEKKIEIETDRADIAESDQAG